MSSFDVVSARPSGATDERSIPIRCICRQDATLAHDQYGVLEATMTARPPDGIGSRDKILWAAATMLGEAPGAVLSVRAIAARAGLSTGSLQHHFPSKQALMEEVMALVYDLVLPDDSIHDTSIPARDRLLACLQRILSPPGVELGTRDAVHQALERYGAVDATPQTRAEYLAVDRELRRRIEHCLGVLRQEGALAPGDDALRARLLLTVVGGLSMARALPSDDAALGAELDVLRMAVDDVLAAPDATA
jgi:AcrR family transcriptional regulator